MSYASQPEVDLLHFLGSGFAKLLGQIVSVREKILSNTNLLTSRYTPRVNVPLPVDVSR